VFFSVCFLNYMFVHCVVFLSCLLFWFFFFSLKKIKFFQFLCSSLLMYNVCVFIIIIILLIENLRPLFIIFVSNHRG
jgi:hypothetical protein